jgi:hypothetical protein
VPDPPYRGGARKPGRGTAAPQLSHLRLSRSLPSPSLTPHPFLADHVFSEAQTSTDIFNASVRDVVGSIVDGYNGTVFAYGQTAAGKTHTMLGA